MIGKAFVFLFIEFKYLFLVAFLNAAQLFGWIAIAQIFPMDGKEIGFVADVLNINNIEITFGE